jgi:hypothetical protein
MDRVQYNSCVADGLRGKKMDSETRKMEFCIVSKLCSGKAANRDAAQVICSQPKAPKPAKEGKKRRSKKQECPEFDTTTLIPRCEAQLMKMVKGGELPGDSDVSGICQLILG